MWLALRKPSMLVFFIHVHKSSCIVLIVNRFLIFCTDIKLWNFYTDFKIFTLLQPVVYKLCDFKVLTLGQNLHTNMEGFHRACHKCMFK